MVYNITKHAKLPFSNVTLHTKNRSSKTIGQGMGSVLLSTGGPGSASSYMDLADYTRHTGRNPQVGEGLKSLSSKLSGLTLETGLKKGKRKNITMSI